MITWPNISHYINRPGGKAVSGTEFYDKLHKKLRRVKREDEKLSNTMDNQWIMGQSGRRSR